MTEMKHYRRADGTYLGQYDEAPEGGIETLVGPSDAAQVWGEGQWLAPPSPEPSLDDLRASKIAAIKAAADALLSAGAPIDSGLHIALDDGSRADLTAMAATATAASTGAVLWPGSYARGWITIENIRIPLATPTEGLELAASAGAYYAAIVQHRRDLKDDALTAEDKASLDSIDISAGWPG